MALGIVWNILFLFFFIGILCLGVGQMMTTLQIWSTVNILKQSIPCGQFPVSKTYQSQKITWAGYTYQGTLQLTDQNKNGTVIISWKGKTPGSTTYDQGVLGIQFDPSTCTLTFTKLSDELKNFLQKKRVKIIPNGRINENQEIIGSFKFWNSVFNVIMKPVINESKGSPLR